MSREKQIDEIAKLICTYPQCTYYNIIGGCEDRECILTDTAEKVYNAGYRKQIEWISVEDGEPEEATNVLCIENDNYYLAFLEDGAWFDCVSYYRDDTFTQVFPSHWMPLPEAPKMKGGVTAESAIRAVQEAALELKNTPPDNFNLLCIGSTMQF